MLKILPLLIALMNGGCVIQDAVDAMDRSASFITITSRTFSDQNRMATPSTFAVFVPPEMQNNLEFESYKMLVEKHLIKAGFSKSDEITDAEFSVVLNYAVGAPRSRIEESMGQIRTYYVHPHYFSMIIVDNIAAANTGEAVRVYQSDVSTDFTSGDFYEISDCLIKAAFRKFPDRNGKVRRGTVAGIGCLK